MIESRKKGDKERNWFCMKLDLSTWHKFKFSC